MDEARRILLTNLTKNDSQKTAMAVIRHVRATVSVVHDKTIEPQALIREILPVLPPTTQRILNVYLDDEDLFINVWDEFDDIRPTGRWCCFA